MARDGDLPTIFNPKRVRAPSVIITSEEVQTDQGAGGDVERANGPPTPLSPRAPLTPQTSISSAPPLTSQPSLQQAYSESATSSQDEERQLRDKKCPRSCCSKFAKKIYFGICVTTMLVASWVAVTHCIKHMYLQEYPPVQDAPQSADPSTYNFTSKVPTHLYNAPFFTAWFCTNWLILFYPLYLIVMLIHNKCKSAHDIVFDAFSDFKEKGFTFARFLTRCGLFCLLWVLSVYMYTYALRILLATDVVALFATNVSCIYLLSWVILHEQFVGVRIVAAILCDTGIALLAYMDGITGSSTLGGVVLAACAAAGFAIFKVLFRKVMGEVNSGQRALFFSILGTVNASLLWPVCLALYLTGSEMLPAQRMPWLHLLLASVALLVFHLVFQFGNIVTYNIFVSLGLITAVPVSAALDVLVYGAQFAGMKLAGIILIAVAFFLVMFPDNWPDYIMRLLRWSRRRQRGQPGSGRNRDAMDYRTGYIRSHLRSPSGRVRIMNWIFILLVCVGLSSCHMTEAQPEDGKQKGFIDWINNLLGGTTTTTEKPSNEPPKNCPTCQCGLARTHRRIVGGMETKQKEYPWMCVMMYGGRFYCGCSLIADLYVVTAAHCTAGFRKERMTVRFLEHDRHVANETKTIDRKVAAIIRHAHYNPGTYDSDIAMLKLDQRIDLTSAIKKLKSNGEGTEEEEDRGVATVCLPEPELSYTGHTATVAGWGTTEEGGSVSNVLREVMVPIISNDECRKSTYKGRITDNMLCAGTEKGGKDACQGDSGGPLHVYKNETNTWHIAGVVSWGEGCARPKTPGVYTRVNRFLTWIKSNTKDACYCEEKFIKKY